MIQTLNSTQYKPTKPSVSLLHSVFLSNLHFLTLTIALTLTAHFLYTYTHCTLYLHLYKKEEPWQQPMCSLINANQLLQEESHGGWKKVDKFANVDNLLQPQHANLVSELSLSFFLFLLSHVSSSMASGWRNVGLNLRDSRELRAKLKEESLILILILSRIKIGTQLEKDYRFRVEIA